MSAKDFLKKNKLVGACYNKAMEICTCISPALNTHVRYYIKFRERMNMKEPVYLTEKINWLRLKVYNHHPLVNQCSDKYRVREYVESCGCADSLIELLNVYDSPEDIVWEDLPNEFILKWNFGSGYNIICTDKNKLDKEETIGKLKRWEKEKCWLPFAELQYKVAQKKIICEKLLCSQKQYALAEWTAPYDYKLYCFNGKPEYIMVCVGREKGTPQYYYFDKQWRFARLNDDSVAAPDGFSLDKPESFDEMLRLSEKLASPFPYVRCDFYEVDGKVYFGELTLSPAGGTYVTLTREADEMMGKLVDLDHGIAKEKKIR